MPAVTMSINLISKTPNAEKVIEEAGRTCYMSFDNITEHSSDSFVRAAIKRGHFSIIEHASATFRISGISRACSHQLVRHRIASYSQQSQRYVRADDFDYAIPPKIQENEKLLLNFKNHMYDCSFLYSEMVKNGILPEDARFILPSACATEVVMTMNFRQWREFIQKRLLDPHAQWEIKVLADEILRQLVQIAPNVFDDLTIRPL